MDFFNVISIDQARELMRKNFAGLKLGTVRLGINEAAGRILAKDVVSGIDVPGFDRSTVDGYAVKSADTHGVSESGPGFMNLVGEVAMGEECSLSINPGEVVYVPTGGMLPKGADAMVMIEYSEKMDAQTVLLNKPAGAGENIIRRGDDIGHGQVVLKKGTKLRSQDVGVLAAIGVARVAVLEKPKLYIISTGDEIIDLDQPLTPGAIRDINGYVFDAMVRQLGGEVAGRTIVGDDFEKLQQETEKAVTYADIVILSGGSSVGVADYTHKVIDSFDGKGVFVHGLAIKPGKPTIIGEAGGKAVFGLPGHPASAIIVFKVIVAQLVSQLTGSAGISSKVNAVLDSNVHSAPGKETYQFVSLKEKDGVLHAAPVFGKSGMITLLSESSGYVVIKASEEGLYKGDEREVVLI